MRGRRLRACAAACFFLGAVPAFGGGVVGTLHDLSLRGPGPFKSKSETQVCVFCHVPHDASPAVPLWSHRLSEVKNYTLYWSSTLEAYPAPAAAPQPDGSSRLCLGCHDGTIALGALNGRAEIPMTGPSSLPKDARSNLGTDLSGGHPISFVVTERLLEGRAARGLTRLRPIEEMKHDPNGVRLDPAGEVQCTSCHDPHDDGPFASSGIHFWRKPSFSAVCLVCHAL